MTEYPLAKTGGYARIYLKWYYPIFKPYIYWFKMKMRCYRRKMFLLFTKSFPRTLTHHKQQSVHKHFSCVLKNIWRIINIKEGSCNIIYKINLSGMSILFPNKGMGRQRQPIGLSSIIYWAKKNQNCRQPKLDSSSGQIYWVISHHQ